MRRVGVWEAGAGGGRRGWGSPPASPDSPASAARGLGDGGGGHGGGDRDRGVASSSNTDCMKYSDTSNAAKSEEGKEEETSPTRFRGWDAHARTNTEYNMQAGVEFEEVVDGLLAAGTFKPARQPLC